MCLHILHTLLLEAGEPSAMSNIREIDHHFVRSDARLNYRAFRFGECDRGRNRFLATTSGLKTENCMITKSIRWLLKTGLLATLAMALQSSAIAEERTKGKFGAWELLCETPPGATSEQCALTQAVRSEERANVSLGVIITKPHELNVTVLRIVAPLSVYLINGVSLKIDQTDIGRAPFFRCSPNGCLSDTPVNEKLLDTLKEGKILTVVIYLEPSEGLRHQVKLEGFKEGYEKLQ
jgi:invasion protein IalB